MEAPAGKDSEGTSGSGSRSTLTTPAAAAAPPTTPAPHRPADGTDGDGRESTGAAATRLAAFSLARFLASAWHSLQVNLPREPTAERVGVGWAAKVACAQASNRLSSLFGEGSETGVYARQVCTLCPVMSTPTKINHCILRLRNI